MKEQAFAIAKHAVLLEETEKNPLHKIHQLQIKSFALSDITHPCKLCMDIYTGAYIYSHIGCIEWLEFQVLQSSTLISMLQSYIRSNINKPQICKALWLGTVVQCSESCNTNNQSGVYASSVYIFAHARPHAA